MLSTKRLDQVLEHEAGDLTAIVEAGIRVRDLNARLADHGQMLALDPPGNPTIGACIAANLSGPRRHRYGTARDLVIGVTAVLADGTIASSGGKVVKNVAGYDLGKVFCGSRGAARADRTRRPAAAPPAGGVEDAGGAGFVARRRAGEGPRDPARAARSVARSTSSGPGGWPCSSRAGRRGVDEQLAMAQALVGGAEDFGSVWEEAEARQARSRGRLLFAPGELAATLAGLERGGRARRRRRRLRARAGRRPARSGRGRARRAGAGRSSTRRACSS